MKRLRSLHQRDGFTIIEVLIVLVVAAVIMTVVFIAIPALQRNARNARRDQDARLIMAAVTECMSIHSYQPTMCMTPESLRIDRSKLSIYTGFHYGGEGPLSDQEQVPPTEDEPNWLFNLKCTADNAGLIEVESRRTYVVTYLKETRTSIFSRCIDG